MHVNSLLYIGLSMNSHRPEILLVFHFFPPHTPPRRLLLLLHFLVVEVVMLKSGCEKQAPQKRKEKGKLAARDCLMAAVSPLENFQVECELFRMCG